ncbi:hypothetical protein [Streptomyces roseifaciens]|uniref:hypothetical protein n=1 Tax=Streptomyces roseifaciens TaxID=1488406 RepID=UPI000717FA45|nr:hypothetical protein [Streptomyces roseifaciens]
MPHRADLSAFADALAQRLPGTWTSQYHPHPDYPAQFPIAEQLWDMAHAHWAVAEFVLNHDAVLTGPGGKRLYVIDRPLNQNEFIVAALAPPELDDHLFHGVPEPNGITVGTDPARAAATVARRLLPRYDKALAEVHRRTAVEHAPSVKRTARVDFAWQADGSLTATTDHPGAIDHLHRAGFHPDPRSSDTFALPVALSTAERDQRLRTVALELGTLGAHVSIRNAPAPAPPAPAPTVLTELVHRVASAEDLHEVAAILDEALDPRTGPLPSLEAVVRHSAARAAETGPAPLRSEFTATFGAIAARIQQLHRDLAELRLGVGEIAALTHAHGEHIWSDLLDQRHTTRATPTATAASPTPARTTATIGVPRGR